MIARLLNAVSCAAMIAAVAANALVCSAAEDPNQASSSKTARDEAIRAIPMQKVTRESQAKIQNILKDVSVYRHMARQTIDCEPDMYLYLGRNPELVVNMWTTMGVTKMSMDRVANDTFRVADGEGTKGTVQILYNSDEMNLLYSEGTYDGSKYPRTVRGKCLLMLRNQYGQNQQGRILISSTLDMFLAVDNIGIELLAKTFSSTVNKAADHNFAETAKFVGKLSTTSEVNPEAIVKLTQKLQHVDQQRKEEFTTIVRAVDGKLAAAAKMYQQQHGISPTQTAAAQAPVNDGQLPTYSPGPVGIPVTGQYPQPTLIRRNR